MRMISVVFAVAAALLVAGGCGGSKSSGSGNKDAATGGAGGAGGTSGCKSSLDCGKNQVCDKASGECVDCLTADDCKSGDKCVGNVCRPPCTSDKDCTPLGLLCDTSNGACVQCIQAKDCPGSEFCASGVCKAQACEPGKSTCQGNGIATCNADGSALGTPVPCGGSKVCVQLKAGAICEEPDAGTGGTAGTGGVGGSGGAGGSSGTAGGGGVGGSCDGSTCCVNNKTYSVTQYACKNFSSASGTGNGGGEFFSICATVDAAGAVTVKAHRYDGHIFGDRPYQVRGSLQTDPGCGPSTYYFVVVATNPTGIGTDTLTFTFTPPWNTTSPKKAFCVTASTQPGDPGYDSASQQQQSWWYSQKAFVDQTTCN